MFRAHLEQEHGFASPVIMHSEDFERWLDKGRMSKEEAATRQHTGLSAKEATAVDES